MPLPLLLLPSSFTRKKRRDGERKKKRDKPSERKQTHPASLLFCLFLPMNTHSLTHALMPLLIYPLCLSMGLFLSIFPFILPPLYKISSTWCFSHLYWTKKCFLPTTTTTFFFFGTFFPPASHLSILKTSDYLYMAVVDL